MAARINAPTKEAPTFTLTMDLTNASLTPEKAASTVPPTIVPTTAPSNAFSTPAKALAAPTNTTTTLHR
jgi:hypothetical protein